MIDFENRGPNSSRILTGSNTASASSGTNTDVWTFASLSIGAQDDTRVIVVALAGASGAGATSVTVGGTSCTRINGQFAIGFTAIWWCEKTDAATTADVVVTLPASSSRMGVGIYRIVSDNGTFPEVYDSENNNATGSPATLSVSVDTKADGYAIACGAGSDAGALTWNSPFTKHLDTDYGGESQRGTSASYSVTTTETKTMTQTCADANLAMAAASFY